MNFFTALRATRAALAPMLEQGAGAEGDPRQLRLAGPRRHRPLGEHGVPETVAQATGVDADTARANVIAGIGGFATGRFSTPEEVAALVTLLASERLGNVTGANYVIDGGLIKTT